MPDEVDFEIERKGICCAARMVWRDRFAAGLVFSGVSDVGVIPLDWARKLRASERDEPAAAGATRSIALRILTHEQR